MWAWASDGVGSENAEVFLDRKGVCVDSGDERNETGQLDWASD